MKLDLPPSRPRNLPEIRDELAHRCEPYGPYHQANMVKINELDGTANTVWDWLALTRARLLWVSADLMETVQQLASTMPEDVPWDQNGQTWPYGFAVFETPWIGTDSEKGTPIEVSGVAWGPCRLRHPDGREDGSQGVGLASWSWLSLGNGVRPEQMGNLGLLASVGLLPGQFSTTDPDDGLWVPLGRSDWITTETIGSFDQSSRPIQLDPGYEVSAIEDRKFFTALWSLMDERRLVDRTEWEPKNKSVKRRMGKKARVTVIHLRKDIRERREAETRGEAVKWRKEVEPYYRMQPYGPKNSLRRKQLITGYERGPEGAPFKPADTIYQLDH